MGKRRHERYHQPFSRRYGVARSDPTAVRKIWGTSPPPASRPDGGIDPHWLREEYQSRQRSLKDIAAETGIPVEALASAARKAGLHHAARHLGIRNAILASQVRQLETTVGTALLHTRPDGLLALTAYGERFARDVRPALESLAQSRKSEYDNH